MNKIIPLATLCALSIACGGGGGDSTATPATTTDNSTTTTKTTYSFDSKFKTGESSVSYSGQTYRMSLIQKIADYAGSVTNTSNQTANSVLTKLQFLFSDTTSTSESLFSVTGATLSQSTFADISSDKNLQGKIAGNDATGQHKTWSDGTSFKGWGDTSILTTAANTAGANIITPSGLVNAFFYKLNDQATTENNGTARQDSRGVTVPKTYITEKGQDLKQLIQKFLLGAVAYSQATDDYLDNDGTTGKGIDSSNQQDSANAYSTLEHQFDEGFGYFGAARDYTSYTDEEIAASSGRDAYKNGYYDTNGDSKIDLKSEYNFGHSVNAAKRDKQSLGTDYTKEAWDAWIAARKLINDNAGTELTSAQKTELIAYRDTIVKTWEKAIAATVVHYINDTITDAKALTTTSDIENYAKHWSELKGFALSLQFNPHKLISDSQLEQLQSLIGDAPELDTSKVSTFTTNLESAKAIMKAAYSFTDTQIAGW